MVTTHTIHLYRAFALRSLGRAVACSSCQGPDRPARGADGRSAARPTLARVTTYFRLHEGDEDPQSLLEPENQVAEPWGGADKGPCDKCHGRGRTSYRCESCVAEGADPGCPACHGRVEYEDICPPCMGAGVITDDHRAGVSVFPNAKGLLRYMIRRGTDLNGCRLVELEGELSGELDFDADEGALLVRPTRIVDDRPIADDEVPA